MNELFKIFHIDAKEAARIADSVNDPHVHDYQELIVGMEGSLQHFIDFKTDAVLAPFVSFVSKGKVHRAQPVAVNGACSMWVIRFKSEFIPETIFQLYALYHDQANLVLQQNHSFKRLVTLCEWMQEETQQESPDYAVIRHWLSAMFTMIESERRKLHPDEQAQLHTHSTTFKHFLTILEDNFRRPEGVEFYAEKLFMSARNLNLICQQMVQRSVSEIIETRKLTEAKNLLAGTDMSVSEIGYELGYNEKAYFTTVFKKKSGQTPTEFRNEMRKLISG
ncbi:MAG: helix-turn-helix transcriptional regulator [Ferruginibacter sp.]|nr:helix-turn-helix transcriptional regulator [Ferruginibacter sp.]